MKIISVEERGDMLVYTTDNKERPDFVYPKDRFDSLDEAMKEINRSVAAEAARNDKKVSKSAKVLLEAKEVCNAGH